MEPTILDSARNHGIADEDMLHALRNATRIFEQDDDMTMWIGPARDGAMLEVGTVRASDQPDLLLIAHAMPMRRKYETKKR